jgi:hypothetical protein
MEIGIGAGISVIGAILATILAINGYYSAKQNKKEAELIAQNKADNNQDLEINTIKTRLSGIEERERALAQADRDIEGKLTLQLSKLSDKIDALNLKIMEVLQQVANKNNNVT